MFALIQRALRCLALIGSGLVMLQAGAGCDPALQFIQTGLLGGITGILYYLARNV